MKKINAAESYEMGRQAFLKGLPSIPTYNKEFWERNNIHDHKKWKENINEYGRGWLEAGGECTPNARRSIFQW